MVLGVVLFSISLFLVTFLAFVRQWNMRVEAEALAEYRRVEIRELWSSAEDSNARVNKAFKERNAAILRLSQYKIAADRVESREEGCGFSLGSPRERIET